MALTSTDRLRRANAGQICVYCGEAALDGTQAPEHPIPDVLGSSITVFTVCTPCNKWANKHVDQPWLSHDLVKVLRSETPSGSTRLRGKRVKHPFFDGAFKDAEGHDVIMTDGKPFYPGSIVWHEGRVSIAATTDEDAARKIDRVNTQLAAKGEKAGETTREVTETRPLLSRTSTIGLSPGVRMGAKLGLAFGAEVFPESWRTSPRAERLREWMRSEDPTGDDGEPLAWTGARSEGHPFADPPNHAAFFLPMWDEDALTLGVLIHGSMGFVIPVADLGTERPSLAWESGPTHSGPVTTTWDALMRRAADAVRAEIDSEQSG